MQAKRRLHSTALQYNHRITQGAKNGENPL